MAAKMSPPVSPKNPLLILDPPECLTFKVSDGFDKKTVANLILTNTSQRRVGFKMKSTAPEYYGADPAFGIVEPNTKYTISVCLWEQPGMEISQLEWKKHKFGISYLIVSNDCREREIDAIIKAYPKQAKSTVLKCVLCNEGEEEPVSLGSSTSSMTDNQKFGSIRPTQNRVTVLEAALVSTEEELESLQETLVLKESIICDLEKKERELTKKVASLIMAYEQLKQLHEGEIEKLAKEKEEAINEYEEEKGRLVREKESICLFNKEMQCAHQADRNQWLEEKAELARQKESAQLLVDEMRKNQGEGGIKREVGGGGASDISFWETSYVNVTFGKEIGHGAYAKVYEGRYMEQKVAIKDLHQLIKSKHYNQLLCREVSLLARVRHPNLVLFIAVAFDHPKGSPLIIMELLTTSLRAAYEKKSLLVLQDYVHIMYDVASALHYLHSRDDPILHRDVSSANVLLQQVSGVWRGKISDFGAANLAKISMTPLPGAMIYSAPETPRESVIEMEEAKEQTTKVDVFSYGVLLCEVFTEIPQLPTKQQFPLMLKSIENKFPKMHNLVMDCIKRDPLERPTMKDILKKFQSTFSKVLQ